VCFLVYSLHREGGSVGLGVALTPMAADDARLRSLTR